MQANRSKVYRVRILAEYNLIPDHFEVEGYLCFEIQKEMHGLKETAILAYDQL